MKQNINNKITQRAQTPPRLKCQTKLIPDSNPDCRINPNPDVCHIAPKMLWIYYLVGVSHFAKFRKSQPMTA